MGKQLRDKMAMLIQAYTGTDINHIDSLVEDLTDIVINDMISKLQAEIKG